jgi:hypothetical protein
LIGRHKYEIETTIIRPIQSLPLITGAFSTAGLLEEAGFLMVINTTEPNMNSVASTTCGVNASPANMLPKNIATRGFT